MSWSNAQRNRELAGFVVLPLILLTVVLLGGLRVDMQRSFDFAAPPLITLVLAALLMLLLVRGDVIHLPAWLSAELPPLTNVTNCFTLLIVFFASAQVFNSVLPERGLFHWMFSFFFLWTLWNNQFSTFDARRLLRSLVVLFGTAFILKHVVVASLYQQDGSLLQRLAATVFQGVTLGTLDAPQFAPATGYISFFTLALYLVGLIAMTFSRRQIAGSSDSLVPQPK